MHLASINIYPIKSCRGMSRESARLDDFGLAGDRRWMVVDEEGIFLSQREAPRLALIEPEPGDGWLVLGARGADPAGIRTPGGRSPRLRVRVWDDEVEAQDAGEEAARWLGAWLDRPCRLVYMPEDSFRRVDPSRVPERRRVHFGDSFPLLLIGEGSLADLNGRLAVPLPMNRFRPNLVVAGTEPFAEDLWSAVRIGDVSFRVGKPCDRCVTTTIDQETGERGKEPLTTLAQYRKWDGQVWFGQKLLHEGPGSIHIGDPVIPVAGARG